ncbi:hypothetical protein LSH36_4g18002 [Paralvinella palmiformis]|uniref:Cytochrome b5 heme-binding domain-containing protein n=1 Tax=Paralvinella palmiformis TaxID=53620 RepID=A0AAD9KEH1_9ANNE|nr:hypothetical protein LSH36_4g18002 [Paralvinella palmiformis]
MGKGDCGDQRLASEYKAGYIPWELIQTHRTAESRWIVIDGCVYDVTKWSKKHPGGARIIGGFAGQDATDAWYAMHDKKEYVSKFMKPLLVGRVSPDEKQKTESELVMDFRELRHQVENMGLFRVNPWFFIGHLFQVLFLEVLAYVILCYYGVGWTPYLTAVILLVIAQAQAGWTQHDYGHLSVFSSSRVNHIMHHFVIGILKGASSHWWNFRHFLHHVKPNAIGKDPDINTAHLFLLGENLPKQWGEKKRGNLPYHWQHRYFWIVGVPLLLPVYFHLENIYFVFRRRNLLDFTIAVAFFTRLFYFYGPLLGGMGAFKFYMFIRLLESFWFVFVTQMNHIPMEIDKDQEVDWVTSQLKSTCNVDPSWFNDWFTGHLNFQIEHHLFPTMPRHNYIHVMPLVKSLCKKHHLNYVSKPMGTAMADILRSLHRSGDIWYKAYYQL